MRGRRVGETTSHTWARVHITTDLSNVALAALSETHRGGFLCLKHTGTGGLGLDVS